MVFAVRDLNMGKFRIHQGLIHELERQTKARFRV